LDKYRVEIISKMKKMYQEDDNILAVWEGGSAATGYLDEYSDLDLCISLLPLEIYSSSHLYLL